MVCCSSANRESARDPFIASYSMVGSEHGQCYCAMRFILDEYAPVRGNRHWIEGKKAWTIRQSQADMSVAMHRYAICEGVPGVQQFVPRGGTVLSWMGGGGDHL